MHIGPFDQQLTKALLQYFLHRVTYLTSLPLCALAKLEKLCHWLVLFRIMQGCAEQSPAELAELAQVRACLGPMTHKIELTQPQ